jgi:hypothetical protein
MVDATGVIEVVPPPASTTGEEASPVVVGRRSTYKLYGTVEQPKFQKV